MTTVLVLEDDDDRFKYFLRTLIGSVIKREKTANDAITRLRRSETRDHYDMVFLDHDLGEEFGMKVGNGMDVVDYICEHADEEHIKAPVYVVHSLNPVASDNMERALLRYGLEAVRAPFCWQQADSLDLGLVDFISSQI